jgi:hypothetical protein
MRSSLLKTDQVERDGSGGKLQGRGESLRAEKTRRESCAEDRGRWHGEPARCSPCGGIEQGSGDDAVEAVADKDVHPA